MKLPIATCSYSGKIVRGSIYSFSSSNEASRIIADIAATAGVTTSFEIRASGEVADAAATIQQIHGRNHKFIYYNETFMQQIERDMGSAWAAKSILAHEIGHHLNNHTLNRYDTLSEEGIRICHKEELEADYFVQRLSNSLTTRVTFCLPVCNSLIRVSRI